MAGNRERVSLATLLPGESRFSADELAGVDAARLKATFRAALLRAGANHAGGWLFASLHGEHDPATDLIHLHWHCQLEGDIRRVLAQLRGQHRYWASGKIGAPRDAAHTPIRFQSRPLTDLPAPLTYIVKSVWLSQDRSKIGENGELRKHLPKPRRIPEPMHSALLLWLNGCRLQDLILMMNLRVINGRIQPR